MEETTAPAVTERRQKRKDTTDDLPAGLPRLRGQRAEGRVPVDGRKDRHPYCRQIAGLPAHSSSLCLRPRSISFLLRELVLHQISGAQQIEGALSVFRFQPSAPPPISRQDPSTLGNVLFTRMLESAWTSLLHSSLRHRRFPAASKPSGTTETNLGFLSSSSSSSLSLWVYEWSQHLRACGQEEEGTALLLLADVFRHRRSFPARTGLSHCAPLPSPRPQVVEKKAKKSRVGVELGNACTATADTTEGSETETTPSCFPLTEHAGILQLLLLLSTPVSSTSVTVTGEAPRDPLSTPQVPVAEERSRGTEVSRQALHAAFFSTPQLDRRALRGTLRGPFASFDGSEATQKTLCLGSDVAGVRLSKRGWGVYTPEVQEQIQAAARRLGLHASQSKDTLQGTGRDDGEEGRALLPEIRGGQEGRHQALERADGVASDEEALPEGKSFLARGGKEEHEANKRQVKEGGGLAPMDRSAVCGRQTAPMPTEHEPNRQVVRTVPFRPDEHSPRKSRALCFSNLGVPPSLSSASSYLSSPMLRPPPSSSHGPSSSPSSSFALLPRSGPTCSAFAFLSVASFFQNSATPSESCGSFLANRCPADSGGTDSSYPYLPPSGARAPGTRTSFSPSSTSFFRTDCIAALQARMDSSHDLTSAETSECPFLLSASSSECGTSRNRSGSARPFCAAGAPMSVPSFFKNRFPGSPQEPITTQRGLRPSSGTFSSQYCLPSPPSTKGDERPRAVPSLSANPKLPVKVGEAQEATKRDLLPKTTPKSGEEPSFFSYPCALSSGAACHQTRQSRASGEPPTGVDEEAPSFFRGSLFMNRHSLFQDPPPHVSSKSPTTFLSGYPCIDEGAWTPRKGGESLDPKIQPADRNWGGFRGSADATRARGLSPRQLRTPLIAVRDLNRPSPSGGRAHEAPGELSTKARLFDVVVRRTQAKGAVPLDIYPFPLQEASFGGSISGVRTTIPLEVLESEMAAADMEILEKRGSPGFLECSKIHTSTYASWDFRLLQPRVRAMLSAVERRSWDGVAGEGGGGGLENRRTRWKGQEAMRCMDTRTQGAVAAFLSVACGTMTVGGLINR